MNKLRNILSLVAVCATAALFTGCGDDDDTVGGGGNNPQANAPDSLSGRTYTLTDSGAGGTLAFDAAAMNYTLTQGGNTENGTYTATKSGDVWTVNATDANGNPATVTLSFNGNGVGNYTLVRGDQTTTGSFAADTGGTSTSTGTTDGTSTSTGTTDGTSTSTGTTDGTSTSTGTTDGTSTSTGTTDGTSTSTGTTDGTSTSTGPVGTLPAPANLNQIVVTTGTGGIAAGTTYTVTLNGNGTFSAVNSSGDDMGSGTYQYTPSGNQANLRLNYPAFGTDNDNMTLFFTSPAGGGANQYTGTQIVSGTSYNMTGTFTY